MLKRKKLNIEKREVNAFDFSFIMLSRKFRKIFKCFFLGKTSMVYVRNDRRNYIFVSIIRTSIKCYRVIVSGYAQYDHTQQISIYKSFTYQYELSFYLDEVLTQIEF